MKIDSRGALYRALRPTGDLGAKIVPYIDRFLESGGHAGSFEVEDREWKRPESRRHMHFHPSGDCLKCPRLLYYERDDSARLEEEPPDARRERIFRTGDAVHAMLQSWLRAMGELPGYPRFCGAERRVVDEGMNCGGYIDAVVQFPGEGFETLLEFKTIGSRGFSMLKGPQPAHRMQLATYLAMTGAPRGIVLYFNKDTQELREFEVGPMDLQPMLMKWSKVEAALEAGDPGNLEYTCREGSRDWERCPARCLCYGRE